MAFEDSSTTVEVRGQRARLVDVGSGDPVVVLHGWGGRIESMAPVVHCLAGGGRVVALDLPGFGESPAPVEAWGTADYASFVRDALASVGVDRADFVAHSFGAKTSIYLAATGDVVRKLVLAGSSGLRRPPSVRARLRRGVSRMGRIAGRLGPPGRALREALYRRIASEDYRNAGPLRPTFVKVVNEDLSDLLPKVRVPTLLVWGTEDDAVPVAHARIMEKAIPDAGLVLFEGAGHFAYLDEADRFCRIVRHFLRPPATP
ncbi:MAG TPA: alpha/beta fold hydrolase [Actinomycetota bacterium]|nr:alpha/beta fold hydrolase [Actinomycetota bacterium]